MSRPCRLGAQVVAFLVSFSMVLGVLGVAGLGGYNTIIKPGGSHTPKKAPEI